MNHNFLKLVNVFVCWVFMKERPSYDAYFMEMAHVVSKRSTCMRRAVGALLVKDKHILVRDIMVLQKVFVIVLRWVVCGKNLIFHLVNDMNYVVGYMQSRMRLFRQRFLEFQLKVLCCIVRILRVLCV